MSKLCMIRLVLFLMILGNSWLANASQAQVEQCEPSGVSIVQLIANPNEYHGKFVRLIGFCRLEFEGDALFLHREDFEQGITKNALWLDIERLMPSDRQTLSDGYILVEAVFDANDKGHLGLFSGCLTKIKRIERWRSRKEIDEYLGGQRRGGQHK